MGDFCGRVGRVMTAPSLRNDRSRHSDFIKKQKNIDEI